MDKKEYLEERQRHWDSLAAGRPAVSALSHFYRGCLASVYSFLVGEGRSVLELGCGRGDLLAALNPARGVGVDFSPTMVEQARQRHPHLEFVCQEVTEYEPDGSFDVIILSDLLNDLWDVQELLALLRKWAHPETRVIINGYSRVWQLPISMGRELGIVDRTLPQNWLTADDVRNLLYIEGFDAVSSRQEILLPLDIPLLKTLCNRYLVRIPPFTLLALTSFIVARLPRPAIAPDATVSVVVPARNEQGNIQEIFDRTPQMGGGTELIFVEGGSSDDTYGTIERELERRPEANARLLRQDGKGKGDAVRKGFAEASGDVLMILDADLTVPPEDLPRFLHVLAEGKAEYVNGVRLVYPMQEEAMRSFNFLGNKFFSFAFSFLLGRTIKDTLCGTKVMTREHYEKIAAGRAYFGEFDPFGDFDLIFGAAKLNLRFVDLPVRYRARRYGDTNISRWKHGWLLIRMVCFAANKIKFIKV